MTTHTGHFVLTRTRPVTPDLLWHLLTDGKSREAWGAPEDTMVLPMESEDFRVGGQDRHRCGPAENPHFAVETRWYNIDAPKAVTFTETIIDGGAAMATTLVTYAVTPDGKGARRVVHVAVASFTGADAIGEVEEGGTGGLSNLEAMAREMAA